MISAFRNEKKAIMKTSYRNMGTGRLYFARCFEVTTTPSHMMKQAFGISLFTL